MTLDEAIAFALSLPDTAPGTSYGRPAVKVASNGRVFLHEGGEPATSFALAIDLDTADMLAASDPAAFWQSPHYRGWPVILVRFDGGDPERVRALIARSREWSAGRRPTRRRAAKA